MDYKFLICLLDTSVAAMLVEDRTQEQRNNTRWEAVQSNTAEASLVVNHLHCIIGFGEYVKVQYMYIKPVKID